MIAPWSILTNAPPDRPATHYRGRRRLYTFLLPELPGHSPVQGDI